MKIIHSFSLIPLLIFIFVIKSAFPALGMTFNVNSTTDAVDVIPGDGICASLGGVCTLRASIQEANASAGDDIINLPAGRTF
jgi:CSLREA domain-containing protein